MAEKKGKALALELMDDLLNDNAEDLEIDKEEPNNKTPQKKSAPAQPVGKAFERVAADIDNDKTIDLGQQQDDEPIVQVHRRMPALADDATVPLNEDQRNPDLRPPRASSNEDRMPRTSVGRHAALRSGAPNA